MVNRNAGSRSVSVSVCVCTPLEFVCLRGWPATVRGIQYTIGKDLAINCDRPLYTLHTNPQCANLLRDCE